MKGYWTVNNAEGFLSDCQVDPLRAVGLALRIDVDPPWLRGREKAMSV